MGGFTTGFTTTTAGLLLKAPPHPSFPFVSTFAQFYSSTDSQVPAVIHIDPHRGYLVGPVDKILILTPISRILRHTAACRYRNRNTQEYEYTSRIQSSRQSCPFTRRPGNCIVVARQTRSSAEVSTELPLSIGFLCPSPYLHFPSSHFFSNIGVGPRGNVLQPQSFLASTRSLRTWSAAHRGPHWTFNDPFTSNPDFDHACQ